MGSNGGMESGGGMESDWGMGSDGGMESGGGMGSDGGMESVFTSNQSCYAGGVRLVVIGRRYTTERSWWKVTYVNTHETPRYNEKPLSFMRIVSKP
jgi:hypothetical protein